MPQTTFFDRVHGVSPDAYAPLLALVIPLGGAAGGLGGSFAIDRLSAGEPRARRWLMAGCNLAAVPLFVASLRRGTGTRGKGPQEPGKRRREDARRRAAASQPRKTLV